jgi:hypothetical protein
VGMEYWERLAVCRISGLCSLDLCRVKPVHFVVVILDEHHLNCNVLLLS